MLQSELVEATQHSLIPNYGRVPISMARGRNGIVWDAHGKQYIDFFAGFGACGVSGHCHPTVVDAVKAQSEELLCCGNLFTNARQVELAEMLIQRGFDGKVFFCHSGAEANEAALKLARLACGKGRYKIISFHGCFHGRTMGALSLTPEKYQIGFEPMLEGSRRVPYGDLNAVNAAVDNETAAIFVEPIQGEGGINVPTREFMEGLRKICDERGILLISDEVWTSPARLGRWFGHQLFDIKPDVMTLGKALGGGMPVAAMVAASRWADVLQPGSHGCTLGGNPICAAAGVAVMRLIERENLVQRADVLGRETLETLYSAGISSVRDIRGKGFMIGIELDLPGKRIVDRCLERGLIINCTQETVIRLAPPLTIEESVLQHGLEILLEEVRSY